MRTTSRSSHHKCSIKKAVLKILEYSQENTCVGAPFHKVTGLVACNFIKKRLQDRCFPVNIAKFLRTPWPTKIHGRNAKFEGRNFQFSEKLVL